MKANELMTALATDDSRTVIDLLLEIRLEHSDVTLVALLTKLLSHREHRIVSSAALALVELQAKTSCPKLLRALQNTPPGQPHGTLLHALGELHCECALVEFAAYVAHDKYECREMALQALETLAASDAAVECKLKHEALRLIRFKKNVQIDCEIKRYILAAEKVVEALASS